jgi:hypothetical protein
MKKQLNDVLFQANGFLAALSVLPGFERGVNCVKSKTFV